MKTIIVLILAININCLCQGLSGVKMSITFYSNYGRTEVEDNAKKGDFITGVLFSNKEPRFVGSGEAFLKVLPDNYQKRKRDYLAEQAGTNVPHDENYSSSLAEHPDKILRYSFYIESISEGLDSINIYSKYIVYEKNANIGADSADYEVYLHDAFFTLPLNKISTIGYLNKVFPEADSITVLFKLAGSSHETPRIDISDYSINIDSIKPSVRDNKQNKITFSGEYIRTNKAGNNLLLRKQFRFTTEENIIYSKDDNSLVFPMTVNWGFTSVPYINYNPLNTQLFEKSKDYSDSRIDLNIMLLPLDKKDNTYTFNLFISRYILSGGYTYSKTIKIKKGGKLRIDLDKSAGIYRHEVIDGKDLYIDVKKDYSDYVNEYLILNLK